MWNGQVNAEKFYSIYYLFNWHRENCKLYIFGLPRPDEDWFLVFYHGEVSNIFLPTGIAVLPFSTPCPHPTVILEDNDSASSSTWSSMIQDDPVWCYMILYDPIWWNQSVATRQVMFKYIDQSRYWYLARCNGGRHAKFQASHGMIGR